MRRSRRRARRGYTLMLVVVFLGALLAVLGVAFQQVATTLRLEEARARRIDFEKTCVGLAAFGLNMLEGEMAATHFEMHQNVSTADGPKTYRLTLDRTAPSVGGGGEEWTVLVERVGD